MQCFFADVNYLFTIINARLNRTNTIMSTTDQKPMKMLRQYLVESVLVDFLTRDSIPALRKSMNIYYTYSLEKTVSSERDRIA